jgi:DNA-binding SARP family transcriptional activator
MNRVDEAKLALRRHHDTAAARAALEGPECRRARQTFAFIAELAGAWEGLALLLEDRDAEALRTLRDTVESMQAGDRILELPVAAVYLAEAEWRAGEEDAADRSAQIALDAAGRQGSNHLLLQSLAFFPAVVSRMVEQSSDSDSPWHELGRALIAQGVSVNVPVAVPVRVLEFGRRALLVDGEEVRPRIAKSYELLSYVIAQARGECDRDQLLDALFDGRQDDSARAYLRQTIRWLREALPPEAFALEGRTVRVGGALAVSSESVELESMLAEAARLRGRDRLEATLRALEIYDQGPYLPGPRGGWADDRDQQLADQITEARYHAAVLAFGEGRYDETRRLGEAVIRQEPYREAAWRLAIRVAQALGDDEGATRAFQGCTRALAEIGARPSSSTRMLVQRAGR